MKQNLFVSVIAVAALVFFAASASADDHDTLVRFKGGIGVIPVSNVAVVTGPPLVVTVTQNIVRGVNPAGQIWVIRNLEAEVKTNGDFRVRGQGLILGGGNNIGRATQQRVIATLICEATAPFIQRSTNPAGVPLADNGDFKIDDVLVPLPTECASPMLLIRNAANLGWFAAGIPVFGDSD